MTDELDQAERIRRLRERRAASPGQRGAAAPATRARRRHPAAATRWLLGGLSVASFFTIAGTIAAANVNSVGTAQPAAPAAVTAAPSVQTAASPAPAPAATSQSATKAAPVVQVVHTTTRGS
jgi:hypothetical protein